MESGGVGINSSALDIVRQNDNNSSCHLLHIQIYLGLCCSTIRYSLCDNLLNTYYAPGTVLDSGATRMSTISYISTVGWGLRLLDESEVN